MKYKSVFLMFALLMISFSIMQVIAADKNMTVYSGKSGFLSAYNPAISFVRVNSDSSFMIYYLSSGSVAPQGELGGVHYEWFDSSSIPKNSKIVSATLYKYHINGVIGKDTNSLMNPVSIANTHRVTLGKLTVPFAETDSYYSNGNKYKNQVILNKIGNVSSLSSNFQLKFDVTDVVQSWVNGENNYGFSFLGNYNDRGQFGTTYYFRNAVNANKPKLIIVYSDNTTIPPVCSTNSQCGTNGFVGSTFCNGSNVYQNYINYTCNNPGLNTSYCSNVTNALLKQTCTSGQTCSGGACVNQTIVCSTNSQCGTNGFVGSTFCNGSNVYQNFVNYTCNNPGLNTSYCSNVTNALLKQTCTSGQTCSGGACVNQTIICSTNSQCGTNGFVGSTFCNGSNVYQNYINYTCNNPGLNTSYCSNSTTPQMNLTCGYNQTCSNGQCINNLTLQNICEYASTASATSQESGAEAIYATGAPNSPISGCSSWGGYGYSWNPTNWNVKANITLNYNVPVNTTNISIIGDYDMCWDSVWLKNKNTGEIKQILNGDNDSCILNLQVPTGFYADTIIIETCGWAWSSTDAVQLCGKTSSSNINPVCSTNSQCGTNGFVGSTFCNGSNVYQNFVNYTCNNPGLNTSYCSNSTTPQLNLTCGYNQTCSNGQCINNLTLQNICEYASTASATSQNVGSEAVNAIGAPNSPSTGECTIWGGAGYDWNPTNWSAKANLTLTYDKLVLADNLTIFGDYDICWDSAWLKNSGTGQIYQVFSGVNTNCTLVQQIPSGFYADTVILETCGTSWTSTDAVQICGSTNASEIVCGNGIKESGEECDDGNLVNGDGCSSTCKIETPTNLSISVCLWKNCSKGAVSVSVDDSYKSCVSELDSHGYKGTYFLMNTNTMSSSDWTYFDNLYKRGYEIGTHTETHICSDVTDAEYKADLQNNINDILTHTSVKQSDIVSHAFPCGYNTTSIQNVLKSNWNYLDSRGYYYNSLESSTPANFYDLKSFNSHGYPGGAYEPPNYFTSVDNTEAQGRWLNLVFHVECSDDGVINYLPNKSIWVDTIGNVVRYIKLRDNATIYNAQDNGSSILFKIKTNYTAAYYNQSITLRINMSSSPSRILFNNKAISYNWISGPNSYAKFDIPFPINGDVEIDR